MAIQDHTPSWDPDTVAPARQPPHEVIPIQLVTTGDDHLQRGIGGCRIASVVAWHAIHRVERFGEIVEIPADHVDQGWVADVVEQRRQLTVVPASEFGVPVVGHQIRGGLGVVSRLPPDHERTGPAAALADPDASWWSGGGRLALRPEGSEECGIVPERD